MALMGVALGATYAGVGFVAREMAVGYVIAPLLGGVLAALFGARRVILISMMVAAAITLVVGGLSGKEYAQVPWALVGVAAGSCLASAVGLAGAWFGPRERGIAAGITIAGIPLGWLAVAFMKSTILHTGGADAWRYGLTPIGAVVALLGLVAFLLARDGPCVAARSGTGQTDRAPSRPPIRWGLVYANATVWLLCAIGISSGLAISISAPTFMGRSTLSLLDWGLGSSPSGTLFAVSAAVGSLSWGLASGRTGRRPALAAAYCILFIALLSRGLLWPSAVAYAAMVLEVLTLYGSLAVLAAVAADSVGPRMLPAAFGLVLLCFTGGQVAGIWAWGPVVESLGENSAFLGTAVLALAAGTMSMFKRERRDRGRARGKDPGERIGSPDEVGR